LPLLFGLQSPGRDFKPNFVLGAAAAPPRPPRIYIGGRRGPAPLRMLRDHLDKVS
jgi:hypothetical protein